MVSLARWLRCWSLLPLAACAEREVWTGARCPPGMHVCTEQPPDVRTTAAEPEAGPNGSSDLDAARAREDAAISACEACGEQQKEAPDSRCPAGRYEGVLLGDYTPAAAGACGLFNLFGGTGQGVFRFAVGERDGGASAPVASIRCDLWLADPDAGVDAGVIIIDAGGVSLVPSYGLLTGSVDCNTGELNAELRGTYRSTSLCTLGILEEDYYFKGDVSALFDPATRSFVGRYEVHEPRAALGPSPGGSATFSVPRVAAAPLLDDASADCFGGRSFPEHLFDAGP
jgi:hypothetical protein